MRATAAKLLAHSEGPLPEFASETVAFLNRLSTPPGRSRKRNYDRFVRAMVAAGVWSKLRVLCLFAPGDQAASQLNMLAASPAPTFNGGLTFGSTGWTGNGSTGYIGSGVNALSLSTPSFGFYLMSSGQDAAGVVGPLSGTPVNSFYPRYVDNQSYVRNCVGTSSIRGNVFDARGLWGSSRFSSTSQTVYRKGRNWGTGVTNAAVAADNSQLCVLRDRTTFSTHTVGAFLFAQTALTDADWLAINAGLEAFWLAEGVLTQGDIEKPYIVSQIHDGTNLNAPEDVLVVNGTAWVPCRDGGTLTAINVANDLSPSILSVFTDSDLTQGIGVAANDAGTVLFLTSWHSRKLISIDISNPASPTKISSITLGAADPGGDPDELRKVKYLSSGYCLCTQNYEGKLYIVNVSNPASMSIVGSVATGAKVFGVDADLAEHYAYLGDFYGTTMYVVDISNKAAPTIVKTLTSASYNGFSCLKVLADRRRMLATFYNSNRLVEFDISTPTAMTQTAITDISAFDHPNRFDIDGPITAQRAYVAGAFANAVGVFDITVSGGSAVLASTQDAVNLEKVYGVARHDGRTYAVARDGDRFVILR